MTQNYLLEGRALATLTLMMLVHGTCYLFIFYLFKLNWLHCTFNPVFYYLEKNNYIDEFVLHWL